MNNDFFPQNFFDVNTINFSSVFSNETYVWDVIPKIAMYIKKQFENGNLSANYQNREMVFIGNNTIIEEGALIKGPAIIGDNCYIGHSSLIRENVVLADGVKIGHASEIKNSIFLNNSAASHFNYVGDSIIGNYVNLSGGSILANYRLDKKEIVIDAYNHKYETGLKKFGSIVGDGSNIGVNSILNPGTILGKNTVVFPLISVRGVHASGETIKQTI